MSFYFLRQKVEQAAIENVRKDLLVVGRPWQPTAIMMTRSDVISPIVNRQYLQLNFPQLQSEDTEHCNLHF